MAFGEGNDLIGHLWKNKLVKGCLVSALVWFFFRYLFSLAAPFFLAFALITLLYPLLERIQKRIPVRKKFLAAGIVLPVLLLVCAALWAVLAFGMGQLQGLPEFCEKVERQAEIFFRQCCCQLDGRFGWEGERIESYVIEQMTVIMENVQIQVVPQMISSSYSCFKGILEVIGFLAITCIAVFLFEKDYTKMVDWVKKEESFRFLWAVVEGVLSYLVTFFKAQAVILLVIAALCSVTLSLAGVEGGLFLGILAGFLDMLPFIGTGIVLVPLSVWQLLNGAYVRMAVCLALYGVCVLARELLEPRLIGNKIGISPIWILFAVYAGVKLFGVGGIVKGPLALIVISEIVKERKEEFDEPFDVY
ncbi:MAG: AI-2E family transporter [Lachnospiraceae bacterium]|nr:AI-2E family transporter [Lachnospiraceae bacterium]